MSLAALSAAFDCSWNAFLASLIWVCASLITLSFHFFFVPASSGVVTSAVVEVVGVVVEVLVLPPVVEPVVVVLPLVVDPVVVVLPLVVESVVVVLLSVVVVVV